MKRLSLLLFFFVMSSLVVALPHSDFPGFSSHESRLVVSDSSLSISDDIIFNLAYYSTDGDSWIPLPLTGSAHTFVSSWLVGDASASIPLNTQYLVVYSCSLIASQGQVSSSAIDDWDCHGRTTTENGFWQLVVVDSDVTNPSQQPLSTDLTFVDIGSVGTAGSLSFDEETNMYTMKSSGDTLSASDSLGFAYFNTSADLFVVDIEFLTLEDLIDSTAGVMLRSGLNSNAISVVQSFNLAENTSYGLKYYLQLISRIQEDINYDRKGYGVGYDWKYMSFPIVLRLIKAEDTFTAYFLGNGGQNLLAEFTTSDIHLSSPFQVGIFVQSGDTALTTTKFKVLNISECIGCVRDCSGGGTQHRLYIDGVWSDTWSDCGSIICDSGYELVDDVCVESVITVNETQPSNNETEPSENFTVTITASSYQSDTTYFPENVYDGDIDVESRWTSSGQQWLQFEFSHAVTFDEFQAYFMSQDVRGQIFDLQVSDDGTSWTTMYSNTSSIVSSETIFQSFSFDEQTTRFIRFVGYGNTDSGWNSVIEVGFFNNGESIDNDVAASCATLNCNDNDDCTDDSCILGVCYNILSYAGCGDACYGVNCGDGNLCTVDSCSEGVCSSSPIAGCDEGMFNSSFPLSSSVFYAGFESGSLDADVGNSFPQTSFSDFFVVDNPIPSSTNPTSTVLKVEETGGGNFRAEYHNSPRLPIDERTYIYTWKEYIPSDFFDNKNVYWLGVGQWKTWPCEDGSVNAEYAIYSDVICPGAGIFNHRNIFEDPLEQDFLFRAEPDCNNFRYPLGLGEWHAYIYEVYWTNTNNGYYNIYLDGELIHSNSMVKTLFDLFPDDGSCDMMWGVGLYGSWVDEGGSLDYYFDDMAIFDVDTGVTVEQVLSWQGFSS